MSSHDRKRPDGRTPPRGSHEGPPPPKVNEPELNTPLVPPVDPAGEPPTATEMGSFDPAPETRTEPPTETRPAPDRPAHDTEQRREAHDNDNDEVQPDQLRDGDSAGAHNNEGEADETPQTHTEWRPAPPSGTRRGSLFEDPGLLLAGDEHPWADARTDNLSGPPDEPGLTHRDAPAACDDATAADAQDSESPEAESADSFPDAPSTHTDVWGGDLDALQSGDERPFARAIEAFVAKTTGETSKPTEQVEAAADDAQPEAFPDDGATNADVWTGNIEALQPLPLTTPSPTADDDVDIAAAIDAALGSGDHASDLPELAEPCTATEFGTRPPSDREFGPLTITPQAPAADAAFHTFGKDTGPFADEDGPATDTSPAISMGDARIVRDRSEEGDALADDGAFPDDGPTLSELFHDSEREEPQQPTLAPDVRQLDTVDFASQSALPDVADFLRASDTATQARDAMAQPASAAPPPGADLHDEQLPQFAPPLTGTHTGTETGNDLGDEHHDGLGELAPPYELEHHESFESGGFEHDGGYEEYDASDHDDDVDQDAAAVGRTRWQEWRARCGAFARRTANRLSVFFHPRTFFREARREWRTALREWRRAGKAKQADVRVEKNREWWKRTAIELAALFAIVVPVEMAVGGGAVGSYGVHPHPYWLIVLPLACARGVVAGLLAAGVGSLLYVIGAAAALSGRGFAELFEFATMREPILFFAVAYFTGELHDELALRFRKVTRKSDDLQSHNQRLRQERDVLQDANKGLERRIVDHSVQFGNLIVAMTRIEKAGRRELFEIALDLVEEHCGAFGSVMLHLGDGALDLLCERGWGDEEIADRIAAVRESPLVQEALAAGDNRSGFDAEGQPPPFGPLVVAPLFDDVGVARAILCLDEVPLSRLNETTVSVFFHIAEWLSAALARLTRTPEHGAPSALVSGPEGDVCLGTPEDLGERLRIELERCARYGVPTSFLAIQATEWKDHSAEGMRLLDRYAGVHFTGGLRPSDSIYHFGYPGCFLLVLAGTDFAGAEVVRHRLLRRIEYAHWERVGPIDIFADGPDEEAPDLASLVERVALRFREASPLSLDSRCPVDIPERGRALDLGDFVRRLRIESSLATRNGFPLQVVALEADVDGEIARDLLSRHVNVAGASFLRPTDGVFTIGAGTAALILPNTYDEDAANLAHRLIQIVRARDPDAPYGAITSRVLSLDSTHPDAASLLAALNNMPVRGEA